MRSELERLRRLPSAQRSVLFQALALLPLVSTGLRLIGLGRVRKLLSRLPRMHRQALDGDAIARMVSIAATRGPLRAGCLASSAMLEALLRRHGIACELRVGVRTVDGRLEAHAWIEYDGNVADPSRAHAAFAPFERSLPEPGG